MAQAQGGAGCWGLIPVKGVVLAYAVTSAVLDAERLADVVEQQTRRRPCFRRTDGAPRPVLTTVLMLAPRTMDSVPENLAHAQKRIPSKTEHKIENY
jgi:hypothetical protein